MFIEIFINKLRRKWNNKEVGNHSFVNNVNDFFAEFERVFASVFCAHHHGTDIDLTALSIICIISIAFLNLDNQQIHKLSLDL